MNIQKIIKNKGVRLLLLAVVTALSYFLYDCDFNSKPKSLPQSQSPSSPADNKSVDADSKQVITGEVTKVADGDTFTLKTEDGLPVKVRLYAIDAPEKGQDFGTKARQHLNELCYKKTVKIVIEDIDQYDRTLGVAYINGLNINEEMVRQGLAWYYSYYANAPRIDSLEQVARKEKLNIWSMKNPVRPHDFRKAERQKRQK